jgi:hypothetical protein
MQHKHPRLSRPNSWQGSQQRERVHCGALACVQVSPLAPGRSERASCTVTTRMCPEMLQRLVRNDRDEQVRHVLTALPSAPFVQV